MAQAQHTIVNKRDCPIYVSLEPNPECWELERGDNLTIVYALPESGDGLTVSSVEHDELVVWPAVYDPEPIVFLNGEPAGGRSWRFRHR